MKKSIFVFISAFIVLLLCFCTVQLGYTNLNNIAVSNGKIPPIIVNSQQNNVDLCASRRDSHLHAASLSKSGDLNNPPLVEILNFDIFKRNSNNSLLAYLRENIFYSQKSLENQVRAP